MFQYIQGKECENTPYVFLPVMEKSVSLLQHSYPSSFLHLGSPRVLLI